MRLSKLLAGALLYASAAVPSSAQTVEMVGSRAQGMGGAFVAVASDASASWWNPGGLAAGPFLDLAWAKATNTAWFGLATPPVGISYYRFRLTDIQPPATTEQVARSREDRGVGLPAGSFSASQFGVTLVHTLTTGVHAGTTLKYVRGSLNDADTGADFDFDAGVLAVAGLIRLGAVIRNIREPEFDGFRLPRQVRIGVAIDPERATGLPLTVALDADVREYDTGFGPRRVIAAGAEHWFSSRRFGVRAGGRFNTVGHQERSATAGATVAVRSGFYVDGHVVGGGAAGEEGWGLAARVSF